MFYEPIPMRWEDARPVLERIVLMAGQGEPKSRRKVQAPRNLIAQAASFYSIVTWNAPANPVGITAYRVYVANTLYATISDANTRKVEVALASGEKKLVEVSAVGNHPDSESPRMPITISANADTYDGGSGGTNPPDPPDWPDEPHGGGQGSVLP